MFALWYLGNFLSGMETLLARWTEPPGATLETSLVEWKQAGATGISREGYEPWKLPSGMETAGNGDLRHVGGRLGNFLVEWKLEGRGSRVARDIALETS